MSTRGALILGGTVVLGLGVAFFLRGIEWKTSPWAAGTTLGSFDRVAVYDNGPVFSLSHGKNYAEDGTYFGQKWQCVEFIKRYLYLAQGHRMPDGMGYAISFYDSTIPQGEINPQRGMLQFGQGGGKPPTGGDLIVFGGAAGYGHVGIVVATGADFIEVGQQNKPPVRETLKLAKTAEGGYRVEAGLPPLGWLRVPRKSL